MGAPQWYEKIVIFESTNISLISEIIQDIHYGRRKPYSSFWMVPFWMTLSHL